MSRADVTEVYVGASVGFTISNILNPLGETVLSADVSASLVNGDGTEISGTVTDNGDGSYYVEFEPAQRGFAHVKLAAAGEDSAWKAKYTLNVKGF